MKIVSELAGKAAILGLVTFLHIHIQMIFRLLPVRSGFVWVTESSTLLSVCIRCIDVRRCNISIFN